MSGSGDKTLKLWDTTNGQELQTFIGHECDEGVACVAFSSDGKIVSSSDDKTLRL